MWMVPLLDDRSLKTPLNRDDLASPPSACEERRMGAATRPVEAGAYIERVAQSQRQDGLGRFVVVVVAFVASLLSSASLSPSSPSMFCSSMS